MLDLHVLVQHIVVVVGVFAQHLVHALVPEDLLCMLRHIIQETRQQVIMCMMEFLPLIIIIPILE